MVSFGGGDGVVVDGDGVVGGGSSGVVSKGGFCVVWFGVGSCC